VKLCSQVLACFLLSATLAVPALAAPDSPANPDRDARRAQKLAKKAERAKTRAKKKAARARSKSAKEATTSKHQVSAEELGKRIGDLFFDPLAISTTCLAVTRYARAYLGPLPGTRASVYVITLST